MTENIKTGNIGVSTENIFKVVKSSLYASREVCIREIVSNAVDATQKLKAIKMSGEEVPEFNEDDLKIWVDLDEENGVLTITDQGIGMTSDEIDKYINNIAYSGITDFLEKYKDNASNIIGHFGLGFYSAFTIAKKVELVTRSYKKDSELLRWSCDGTTEFTIEKLEDSEEKRPHDITWGTSVIMYLDDESKEEFKKNKVKDVLQKHSRFVPVTLVFGKKQTWDSSLGKQVDTDEDQIINDIEPIWNKRPGELKDEDYKEFFKKLYPNESEPVFWIHLNVEDPWRLKGILFMPSTKDRDFTIKLNNLYLYSNNVFVTDDTHGVGLTDKFLSDMIFGCIDIDDSIMGLGLNVSRSYLQGSNELKKVASYINKKIADKLKQLLKDDRKKYEEIFDDIRVVLNYGILSVNDFYDKIKDAYLFKTTSSDGKFYTMDEYKTLIETNQKDKDETLVYLYATDENEQATYIQAAENKGYSVLKFDTESLDIVALNNIERNLEKSRFTRVDSDTINKLIPKNDETLDELSQDDKELLSGVFNSVLEDLRETGIFNVNIENIGENELPCSISQPEWSRRMKDNSRFQSQMWFNGFNMYTMNLNSTNQLIKDILSDAHTQTDSATAEIKKEIDEKKVALDAVNEELKDVEWESRTEEQKTKLQDAEKAHQDAINKKTDIMKKYGKSNKQIAQLIDIALLGNGLLKGEKLANFLKRSVEFLKK